MHCCIQTSGGAMLLRTGSQSELVKKLHQWWFSWCCWVGRRQGRCGRSSSRLDYITQPLSSRELEQMSGVSLPLLPRLYQQASELFWLRILAAFWGWGLKVMPRLVGLWAWLKSTSSFDTVWHHPSCWSSKNLVPNCCGIMKCWFHSTPTIKISDEQDFPIRHK